jgi:hypothetical protein
MFSFFPCIPREEGCQGFKRPVIEMPGLVTPALNRKFRLNCGLDKRQIRDDWQSVVEQVLRQDLWLGIQAQMPNSRRPPR